MAVGLDRNKMNHINIYLRNIASLSPRIAAVRGSFPLVRAAAFLHLSEMPCNTAQIVLECAGFSFDGANNFRSCLIAGVPTGSPHYIAR